MKKIIIILFLILILIVALCYFALNVSSKILTLSTNQKESSDTTLFEIHTDKNVYDQNDKYMRITIYNNSGDGISTGHGYTFEVRKNNKWYVIHMKGYFVYLSFLGIGNGEKHDEKFSFDAVSYKFVPGYQYRVTKEIDDYIIVSNIFKFE